MERRIEVLEVALGLSIAFLLTNEFHKNKMKFRVQFCTADFFVEKAF